MVWWLGTAVAAASAGRLEGVVTSPVDGRALPNVDVILRLESAPAAPPRLGKTDRTGAFAFEALPAGLYALDVIGAVPGTPAPGYVWTHVSPILVVPGTTATQQVVLAAPPLPRPPPSARDT
jgi:hypothetical protein